MHTPEQLKATVADWDDDTIEGYWELVDTAARVNTARGDQERAEQCQALADTCEEILQGRWSNK